MQQLADPRDPRWITYPMKFLLGSGVLLFLLRLGSRRQLKYQLGTKVALANLNGLVDTAMEQLEHPDTLAYLLRRLDDTELPRLLRRLVRRLIRMRCLERYRFENHYLIAIDATGYLAFRRRHCPQCLTQRQQDVVIHYHPVLEAKLVTSSGLAISLATEFIENPQEGQQTQDCELAAFYRLAPRLKSYFPHLPMCLLLDGLYAVEEVMRICADYRWAYLITFREGRRPEGWEEYQRLRQIAVENRLSVTSAQGVQQDFAWVNGLECGKQRANVLECRETTKGKTTPWVWLTRFRLTHKGVSPLAATGRLRWKIENEGFNTQKNGGYNLEHAYSKNWKAAKNFYALLQMGHLLGQLLEKANVLRQKVGGTVQKVFGSLRNLVQRLLESFRYWVISKEARDPEAAQHIQIRLDTS